MKLIATILATALLTSPAYGKCNWSLDVVGLEDSSYKYTLGCHMEVGLTLMKYDNLIEVNDHLSKSLLLKNDIIKLERSRADKWRSTAFNLEDRMIKVQNISKKSDYLYFGLGILTTLGAAWAVNQASQN